MRLERPLLSLCLLAAASLLVALTIAGRGPELSAAGAGANWLGHLVLSLPSRAAGFVLGAELPTLALGAVMGWWLRWAYGLPWAEYPRTIYQRLLGWGANALKIAIAGACVAIFLLY